MRKTVTVVDLLRVASERGDHIDTVVEVMRRHMDLSRVPISHALGQDAEPWFKRFRAPSATVEGVALWAATPHTDLSFPAVTIGHHWMDDAACRKHDTANTPACLWTCHDETSEITVEHIEAVKICSVECPKIGECAVFGLQETEGLLAGMTNRTRRDFRRWVKLGVVPPTLEAFAALARDAAKASLAHRMSSASLPEPAPQPLENTLFEVQKSSTTAVTVRPRRKPERSAVHAPIPLFACDTGPVIRAHTDGDARGPLPASPLAGHG